MDSTSIIDYIKKNYPKVVFTPFKFKETKALAFILSDKNLVIGFINANGTLCKLIEPIDISNMSSEYIRTIIQKIPVVNGFTDKDKTRLLRVFEQKEETISKQEHNQIVKDLEKRLSETQSNKDSEYKVLFDSKSSEIVLIKKEYEDKIKIITDQYNDSLKQLDECRKQIVDQNQSILEGIEKYKESMKEFIASKDFKIEELEKIHKTSVEERKVLQERLDNILESEKKSMDQLLENKDLISDYDQKLQEKSKIVEDLKGSMENVKKQLEIVNDELKKSQLENELLRGYKTRCRDKVLQEKDEIIDAIKKYNETWLSWVEKTNIDVKEQKSKLIEDFKKAKENLQKTMESQLEESNLSNKEVKRLNQNIKDIETSLQKTINEQLIELSKQEELLKEREKSLSDLTSSKSDLEKELSNIMSEREKLSNIISEKEKVILDKDRELSDKEQVLSEKEKSFVSREKGFKDQIDNLTEKNKRIPELQKELDELRLLLEKNRNTPIEVKIDYENCYSIITNFVALNNMFYRKQEIIKKLDDIINNNLGVFNNLNESMKQTLKGDFEKIKAEITNHIKFLNLSEYISSPNFEYLKSKATRSRVPESFCKDLSNLLEYWNLNKLTYREQDIRLTNIYEDLSGAVRIYIRIKPLGSQEKLNNTVEIKTVENKKTKGLMIDCSPNPDTKFKQKNYFGEFYGIFEEDFTNLDVYTGQRGTIATDNSLLVDINNIIESSDTISPGLYSTFKQVEQGYSIVLFGYGISGSGKCHGKGTEILMYDGSIKKVEDIKKGDLLMGDDSTPRKVLSLARGRDRMYEISNIKGDRYIVNSEHILTLKYSKKKSLFDRKDRFSYQVCYFDKNTLSNKTKNFSYKNKDKVEIYDQAKKYLEKIKDDLIVDIPLQKYLNVSKGYKTKLKGFKVPVEFEYKPINLDPYMLGIWLGDGHTNSPCITNQDAVILKYFRDNLSQYNCYLSFQKSSKYVYRICSTDDIKHHEHSNKFTKMLYEYNVIGNKHIPDIYKCNSRKIRLEILAGLIDSDGHLDKNGGYEISQSTKHERLIDDIIFLARSLGFACYKNIKKTSWTHRKVKHEGQALRVHIYGEGIDEIPTKCFRKKSNPRKQIKDPLVSSINVKKLEEDDYYGFELDGNHRYVLGDFTVTHNTFTLIGSRGNPGVLHYGLANLEDVKSIRLKYLFEQSYYKINFNNRQLSGTIYNLVNQISQLKAFSIDETKTFEKLVPSYIDLKNLKVEDIYSLTDIIEKYRIGNGRIKKTPNNPVSSRSHLYLIFEITFGNGKRGFVTVVDTAGRESPVDIFNTFLDSSKTSLASVMAPPPVGGVGNIEKNLLEKYRGVYRPNDILEILNEGFYINETINHLIYYFNLKNGKVIETPKQKIDKRYNVVYRVKSFFVQPQEEEKFIDGANNALMIPILKFLDNLSTKAKEEDQSTQDWKPTKFITICAVRQELNYCDQTTETLEFAQSVKSS